VATNDFAVVVLSKYPDILQPLLESIEQFEDPVPRIIVVQDRNEAELPSWCESVRVYAEPFCFAKNANIGIKQAGKSDVLLANDDVRLIEPNTFQTLAAHANLIPSFGIVSPRIKGCVGNPYQNVDGPWPPGASWLDCRGRTLETPTLAFVCVYIKRRLIDEIGLLDENFVQYGWEDNDLCLRARRADWKTVIFKSPVIQHGDGSAGNHRGRNWSLSYARDGELTTSANYQYLLSKYAPEKVSS
jgi:hypothetical protein